jgi:hypothetical protein
MINTFGDAVAAAATPGDTPRLLLTLRVKQHASHIPGRLDNWAASIRGKDIAFSPQDLKSNQLNQGAS